MTPIILWAILSVIAAVAAIAVPKLWNWLKGDSGIAIDDIDDDDSEPNPPEPPGQDEWDQSLTQQQLQQDVGDILSSGESRLIGMLSAAYGSNLPESKEEILDEDLVRKIAATVKPEVLRVLGVASREQLQFDNITLTSSEKREVVPYPADETEFGVLDSDDDLLNVLPEELAQDDDVFNANLAASELHVLDNVEIARRIKRLYMLLDLSGSTDEKMDNGAKRVQWEDGIALRLLFQAMDGDAEYMIRTFGEIPYELQEVRDEFTANAMAHQLLELGSTMSGTDIMAALETAHRDVTTMERKEVQTSDVLLITDGQANVSPARLEEMFGKTSGIRLHVASIGLENPDLKAIATSYQVYV